MTTKTSGGFWYYLTDSKSPKTVYAVGVPRTDYEARKVLNAYLRAYRRLFDMDPSLNEFKVFLTLARLNATT